VTIGTAITKPTFETIAQILIKLGRENIYVPTVPTSGNLIPVFSFNREEQINSEIEILKSQLLAEKVIQSLGPASIHKGLKNPRRGILNVTSPPQRWDNCYGMHPILSKIYGRQAQRCS